MRYEIIQPPFTLRFRAMSREEAGSYFDWFIEQIPIRIKVLECAVQSMVGYEDWKADCTSESLERLGQWFYEQVGTRRRTKGEKETIYSRAPEWFSSVEIEDWELTNRTFSLTMDIGMYFGHIFEKNLPKVRWVMVEKPKKDVDFQQPVIAGTGNLVFNPVRIMVTYAYGIARRSKGPERLRKIYDIWANILVK